MLLKKIIKNTCHIISEENMKINYIKYKAIEWKNFNNQREKKTKFY